MSFDLVCVGPPFLDVTFVGLERLPAPGEELYARELTLTPGGAAIAAIGAARLGLRAALVWPRGTDVAGNYLRAELAAEGVDWLGRESPSTAVTAVFPLDGERAFATYEPAWEPTAEEVAGLDTRALLTGLGRATPADGRARVYVTGDYRASARSIDGLALGGCRALLVNESEALRLTGAPDAAAAAAVLASTGVDAAVVTLGSSGALEWADGGVAHAPAPEVDVRDTTGAGDLFAVAYVFADLAGAAREERLAFAGLYAGLSVRATTGVGGALALRELEHEARLAGLPSVPSPVSRKENR
jgi:sugar/nucleoside kinase (ribokinase family)